MAGLLIAQPPSRRWYRLAGLLAAAGLVAALAWWPYAATRVHNEVMAFERISRFGGEVEMAAGPHTLWAEGECLTCHGNDPAEYRAVADLAVEGAASAVRFRPADDGWLYNTGSREGRALYVLDVPAPGSYTIRFSLDTASSDWDNRSPEMLAISAGEGLSVGIVRPMVALGGGGIASGLALYLLTAFRQRRFYDRRFAASSR